MRRPITTQIYSHWKGMQQEKFEKIFRHLGENFLAQLRRMRLIDIGAGAGYLEEFLVARGVKNTVALEPDRKMLKQKKNFVIARAEDMPFRQGSFDAAFIVDAIHLMEPDLSCLKRGGLLVAAMFCTDDSYEERRALLLGKLENFEVIREFTTDSREKEAVVVAKKR